jgi:transposase-like protein
VDSPDDSPEREPLLDDHAIEAIARRVTQLLRQDPVAAAHERLVSAAEIARRFGVSRAWVYENADRLGAVRLGRGARPRLRFDPQKVKKRLDAAHERASPGPRRALGDQGSVADADLIPIREL